ncbi:unnamed protein product [Darwinula stevensoni]|uniref:Peptidase M14 domain-containing protein n=1 Tax=Darwinula stevensoni TaxID=69355 RepID=A0A7R9AIF2_9CRUS|nr:unnamed protein product [Darwinula stevensoni]CAG0906886.1 unnamed protein product [Darwinula stevensoni]
MTFQKICFGHKIKSLVDFLISSHPIAVTLREHVVFKIVPMLNPDGAFLGNYRTNVMGMDLNRQWTEPSQWAHPTVFSAKNLISDIDEDKNADLDFVIDLHAHTSLLGAFVYGNIYDDVYRYERHIVFPKMLSQVAEDYNANNCVYNRDPQKVNCARSVSQPRLSRQVLEFSAVLFSPQTRITARSGRDEGFLYSGEV